MLWSVFNVIPGISGLSGKAGLRAFFFSALNNEQQSWRNNSLFFDCQTSKSDTLWVRSFIYTFISTLYRPPIV